jgi:hypothetical protein
MWNWFNCYLSGRHDYGVWCEPGTIYLRCIHCGRRSSGWAVQGQDEPAPPTITRPAEARGQRHRPGGVRAAGNVAP